MFGLNAEETALFKQLSTPEKIQSYLDNLPINYEKNGGTCNSPRVSIREQKAHCIEGAFIAATAFWYHGERPLLLDLKTFNIKSDPDHVVALYKKNGYWGSVSKTNHNVLRSRDPIYKTTRELALSYFHEYFLATNGEKTMRTYSRPFSLKQFGSSWITREDGLWDIAESLDTVPHFKIVPDAQLKYIIPASHHERTVSVIPEWTKDDPRT